MGISTKTSFNSRASNYFSQVSPNDYITNVYLQNFVIKLGITKYHHPLPDSFSYIQIYYQHLCIIMSSYSMHFSNQMKKMFQIVTRYHHGVMILSEKARDMHIFFFLENYKNNLYYLFIFFRFIQYHKKILTEHMTFVFGVGAV